MKYAWLIGVALALLFVFAAALFYFSPDAPDPSAPDSTRITLYYYNPAEDMDEFGSPRCSQAGVVGVDRVLKGKASPEAAIRLLLLGNLTDEERDQGITSVFPIEGLSLESTSNESGTLVLTFSDRLHGSSGGACRATILRMEIETTAKQFPGIDEVRIEPEEVFQP